MLDSTAAMPLTQSVGLILESSPSQYKVRKRFLPFCSCSLSVLGGASVLLYPGDTITTTGTHLALTCTAAGIPPPQITWSLDGQLLASESYNITEEQFFNDSSHFTLSVLNLCDLQFSDSGEYSCTASNTITEGTATDTRFFMLEAQGEL